MASALELRSSPTHCVLLGGRGSGFAVSVSVFEPGVVCVWRSVGRRVAGERGGWEVVDRGGGGTEDKAAAAAAIELVRWLGGVWERGTVNGV